MSLVAFCPTSEILFESFEQHNIQFNSLNDLTTYLGIFLIKPFKDNTTYWTQKRVFDDMEKLTIEKLDTVLFGLLFYVYSPLFK